MAAPETVAPLIHALESAGAQLLDADKATIETFVNSLADADANAIVSAIASNITMHGIAGAVQQPLRNAIVGAEPTIDATINSSVSVSIDDFEAFLKALAAR